MFRKRDTKDRTYFIYIKSTLNMFVWKNGDLNPELENAIFYEDSVLLVACPGSG